MARKTPSRRQAAAKTAALEAWAVEAGKPDPKRVRSLLRRASLTLDEIATKLDCTRGHALDAIEAWQRQGMNVQRLGDAYTISAEPAPVPEGPRHKLVSDAKGCYRIGLISDSHYGSKYAREDVAEDLYRWFAAEGVRQVYHCGNWIDGEARFNRFDLLPQAHGMQAQLDYFVERYPQVKGITTGYVAGDDHEGWYAQREGVDIGQMLEDTARRAGRTDLQYLGYMEAFITLQHKRSGESSRMLLMHPGGGSAYATSYAPQKVVESLQGGEKPAVIVFGHWHKLDFQLIRGVWSIQAGCTKDLDPFGRKKRLAYHVGGQIVDLWQDERGAITSCRPWVRHYFDRGYYNGQFSLSGPIAKRPRTP